MLFTYALKNWGERSQVACRSRIWWRTEQHFEVMVHTIIPFARVEY